MYTYTRRAYLRGTLLSPPSMTSHTSEPTMSHIETHARELYAFERLADPSLPTWDEATYMTRSRWLRAAASVRAEVAA